MGEVIPKTHVRLGARVVPQTRERRSEHARAGHLVSLRCARTEIDAKTALQITDSLTELDDTEPSSGSLRQTRVLFTELFKLFIRNLANGRPAANMVLSQGIVEWRRWEVGNTSTEGGHLRSVIERSSALARARDGRDRFGPRPLRAKKFW